MKLNGGLSFVEILISVGLFGLLIAGLNMAVRWQRSSMDALEKTDLTAKLRNTSIIIGRNVSLATRFLFPSSVSSSYESQMVFLNKDNEVGAIYLNEKNVLCYYNYSTDNEFEIAPSTTEFKVRLVSNNLIEYKIALKKDEYDFFLQNRLSTCNTLP